MLTDDVAALGAGAELAFRGLLDTTSASGSYPVPRIVAFVGANFRKTRRRRQLTMFILIVQEVHLLASALLRVRRLSLWRFLLSVSRFRLASILCLKFFPQLLLGLRRILIELLVFLLSLLGR